MSSLNDVESTASAMRASSYARRYVHRRIKGIATVTSVGLLVFLFLSYRLPRRAPIIKVFVYAEMGSDASSSNLDPKVRFQAGFQASDGRNLHKVHFRELTNEIEASLLVIFGALSQLYHSYAVIASLGDDLQGTVYHKAQFRGLVKTVNS